MISIAKYSDKESLIKLWREAFSEEPYAVRFYENAAFEDILVWREEGQAVSMLHFLPCFYVHGDRTYRGAYLYALATAKDYRKKGIMGELIKAAKTRAKEQNLDFLFLIAAERKLCGYYEKYGFCVAGQRKETAVLHFHNKIEEYVQWECMQEADSENTSDKTVLAENQMVCRMIKQPDCIFVGNIPY